MSSATLRDWRPIRRGASLRGFASIALPSGMEIHEVAVHIAENGRGWASPPSKPMMSRDGQQLADSSGKLRWTPLITFASRERADAFSQLVLRAIADEHARDLEGWADLAEVRR